MGKRIIREGETFYTYDGYLYESSFEEDFYYALNLITGEKTIGYSHPFFIGLRVFPDNDNSEIAGVIEDDLFNWGLSWFSRLQ